MVLMKKSQDEEDGSREEFEQTMEFLKKLEKLDHEEEHKGIFLEYINVMRDYKSGSLSEDDVKHKVSVIFKNCDVLLDDFHQLLKNAPRLISSIRNDHDDVMLPRERSRDGLLNLKCVRAFVKVLSRECRDCEGVRSEFIEMFARYMVHKDVRVFKKDGDSVFRGNPLLKEEFRMMLVENRFIKGEITAEEEDEMFEADMYRKGLKLAIEYAMEEGDSEEKPSVGVYGAMRRFYAQRRKKFLPDTMKNPKLAVQSVLPALKRKYQELEEQKEIRLSRCTLGSE